MAASRTTTRRTPAQDAKELRRSLIACLVAVVGFGLWAVSTDSPRPMQMVGVMLGIAVVRIIDHRRGLPLLFRPAR